MVDWENLRYFLITAREGSVSSAAKYLGVSHSTVLRRLDRLEQELASKLFRRLQSGYQLTAAGAGLAKQLEQAGGTIEKSFAHVRGDFGRKSGELRVSVPEPGIFDIQQLHLQFIQQNPDISLDVYSTMNLMNLNKQEVDVVIRLSETPPELLVGRLLGSMTMRAYASEDYLKNHQDLRHTSHWIIYSDGNETRRKWIADNIIYPVVVLKTTAPVDLLMAVQAGLGVALLPSQIGRATPGLVELFEGEIIEQHKLWILTHRDLRNSARVQTYIKFMAENLKFE